MVILERGNASAYDSIGIPNNWIVREYEGGKGAASHHNKVFEEFPNEPYYASVADDVIPETMNWDVKLKYACMPDKVAVPNEGIDRSATHGAKHFPTHCFIGGDLVRKWGFIAPPVLDHFYVDNWWHDAGEQVVMPDVHLTHLHFKNGKAEKDETYHGRPNSHNEERAYQLFCLEHAHLLHKGEITLHRKKVYLDDFATLARQA